MIMRAGDETNRSYYRDILAAGVPAFLESLFTTFASIIDSKMVSAMGERAISAVSVTNHPRLFIFSIFFAFNTVVSSLVAKYLGKKDRKAANQVFANVIVIVIVLSIVLSIITVLLARPIMDIFAHQPDTLDDSVIYFKIVMGGMIFNLLFLTINAAFRGCGKTRLTLYSNILSCVVNIIFNYLLIEGHLGFPAMGIKGAAIATVAGTVAALILSLVFIFRKKEYVNVIYCFTNQLRMTRENMMEILSLARSTIVDGLVMRFSLLFIGGIVARIGSFQMAVYSVGMHLMNVNFALGTGLQTSGVALIGRSFGANDKEKMLRYKSCHIRLGLIASIILAVLIMSLGRIYSGFFSDDPLFIQMGTISCLFIGVNSVFQTMKFTYTGFLMAIGEMRDVMISNIIGPGLVNLGLSAVLILVLHIGIWGAWSASVTGQLIAMIMVIVFTRKKEIYRGEIQ